MNLNLPFNLTTVLFDIALDLYLYLLYRPVLHSPFVFDDLTILNNIHLLRRIDPLTSEHTPGLMRESWTFIRSYLRRVDPRRTTTLQAVMSFLRSRFLTRLSYQFNVSTGGLNPYHYHLTNLVIAAYAVGLFHHLLLRWVGEVPAFLGALLLASHPLTTMAVAYIAGRSSLLAGAVVIASLLVFVSGHWVLAGGLVVVGLLVKEEAVVAIPLILYLVLAGGFHG